MNRKLLFSFTLICFFSSLQVLADTPARPQPYTVEAGEYIFVNFVDIRPDHKDKYLQSVEEPYKKNCENPKRQTDRVKRWCDTILAIKRHPHSGVYRKDDPSKPVWWGGKCSWASYLSSDGEYVARMGPWAGSTQQLAVAFCKRQELIAIYIIDDLIDDEEKLQRSVSHFFWESETTFDSKTSTLYIRTVDNNEYTFDIRTGKIVKYKYTPPPLYQADIRYRNGERKNINDLTSCTGMTYATLMQGMGNPVHELQVIEPVKKEKNTELVRTGSIPFLFIKNLKFVAQAKKDRMIWTLTTDEGKHAQVMVESSKSDFCGIDNAGNEMRISAADIDEMELSPKMPTEPYLGIRTVAQRMRWDKENWGKASKAVCDNTDFKKYKTLRDMKNMVAQFKRGGCTIASGNFINALAWADQWLRKQPVNMRVTTFAIEFARFYRQFTHPRNVVPLYEYALQSYDYWPKEDNWDFLYAKQKLLGELVNNSMQANYPVKTQTYQKLLAEVDKDIERRRADNKRKSQQQQLNKMKEFQQQFNNMTVDSIEDNHIYLAQVPSYTLDHYCKETGEESSTAVAIYQRIAALEEQYHRKGHMHRLQSLLSLSNCAFLKSDHVLAKQSYQKALDLDAKVRGQILQSKKDKWEISQHARNLSRKFLAADNSLKQDAIALLAWSISLYKDMNENDNAYYSLNELAKLYEEVGDLAKAEQCLLQNVQLAPTIKTRSSENLERNAQRTLRRFYIRTRSN